MGHPPYSLEHEYERYVEREIESYKESIPRSTLLRIGDEAVASLAAQAQLELNELVLWIEVDRLITRRLRLPNYRTWRARRIKMLERFRRPEHWGMHPDDALVRAIHPSRDARVLVAGNASETPALYLAAHGFEVTAVDPRIEAIERVMSAAELVGLVGRVHGCVTDLNEWLPDDELSAVVCTPEAFTDLPLDQRAGAISRLQRATSSGGVHLIRTIADLTPVTLDELRSRYHGWQVSIEADADRVSSFLARKTAAWPAVAN